MGFSENALYMIQSKSVARLQLNKICRLLILSVLFLFALPVLAQNTQNLSSVRVDELSDAQIRQFIQQVEASGLSEAQLEQVASARGMAPSEISKLRERVNKLKQNQGTTDKPKSNTQNSSYDKNVRSNPGGRQLNYEPDSSEVELDPEKAEEALNAFKPKVFGSDLFKNSKITFEPNLRIATPANYSIGPDDQINIDIYGYSEASYKLVVSPEGTINIPYVGVVQVSGLSMEQATARIRSRLSTIYSNINTGNTKVAISLGDIRSIKVTLVGEVTRPGTYTLPSLATAFNALYASGGPTENGSFRTIEVIRNSRVVSTIDVYDFLLRGFQRNNVRLQDQDVIRIPTYRKRVQFSGEVKRPYIFEALDKDRLRDIIEFAGGFTTEAYTARIKIIQNTAKERRITDVFANEFGTYTPNNGDKYFAEPILERFENRVVIEGAVFRPGAYELEPGLTLSQLIKKAEGVKEDAFLPRGYIKRLRTDNTSELISFDLARIINQTAADIALLREDSVTISSIFDLRDEYRVTIEGEVRNPGQFGFSENQSLEDLIQQAGGFKEGASARRIEISRRVRDAEAGAANSKTSEVFQVDVDQNLRIQGPRFVLQPFDIVVVRNAPGYETQRNVRVEGEVLYPGTYTITRKDERISDLVGRAGGFTDLAYLDGASLKRGDAAEKGTGKNRINSKETDDQKVDRLKRLQSTVNDSTERVDENISGSSLVGINLNRIIENPKAKYDLILEEGDVLMVPKQLQTVKVNGEVLSPVTVIYESRKGFKEYIANAGGFSQKALRKRAYVLYPNGSIQSTKRFLGFNNYPIVKAGAEIFVPTKEEKRKITAAETVGLASALASMGAIIIGILNTVK